MLRVRTGVVGGDLRVPVARVQGAGLHQVRPGVEADPLGAHRPARVLQGREQRRPAAGAAGARIHVHPGELGGGRVQQPYPAAGQGSAAEPADDEQPRRGDQFVVREVEEALVDLGLGDGPVPEPAA